MAEMVRTARAYRAIEIMPHSPKIEGHYYACQFPKPGDGKTLEKLLDRVSPATPIDRDFLCAAFVTPMWGGPCGARPAFVVTSDAG